MGSIEILDHTADVGIRANGNSIEECFSLAAQGMMDIVTDLSKVQDKKVYSFQLNATDMVRLLYTFLSDVLYRHHTEYILFSRFDVKITTVKENDFFLQAQGRGEVYDRRRHTWEQEIKAVTFHELKVESKPEPFVEVLFDI